MILPTVAGNALQLGKNQYRRNVGHLVARERERRHQISQIGEFPLLTAEPLEDAQNAWADRIAEADRIGWAFSNIRFCAEMGLLLALWMGISFLASCTFVPALLVLWKPKFFLRAVEEGIV